MSVSSFRAVVRSAGNLETENKIYGSFRSLNKFEPVFESNKHADIFEKFDIEPAKDVPPLPPTSSIDRKKKKKIRRNKESTKENEKVIESRHGSQSIEKVETNIKSEEQNQESNSNDPDEKIKEAVRRMTNKRQRRAEKNHLGEIKNSESDQDKVSNRKNDQLVKTESIKNQNSNPKLAFEEKKTESESDGENDAKIEIEKTKSKEPANIQNTLVGMEYFKPIKAGDTLDFTLCPPPQGQLVHGKIICKKGIFNEYFFYLENYKNSNLYIMKATRKMTSAKVNYTIDTINYDQYGIASSTEVSCARIVSNMSRKKFKLNLSNNFVQFSNTEILNVSFKTKPGDPRKILACASLCHGARNSKNDKVTYFLKNKQPVFKMDIKQYVLNYNGRAKRSSKNNFQIIDETSPDVILTQLGKVEDCVYNCDFAFPLCAIQAFGFALANLCR